MSTTFNPGARFRRMNPNSAEDLDISTATWSLPFSGLSLLLPAHIGIDSRLRVG